jgi:HAD superfamily phosphoserine phosphatase-like hydrolase
LDKILFVDVCHTIVPHNTTVLFLEKYYINNISLKKIRRTTLVKTINYVIFKLFKVDLVRLLYISYLKGESLSSVFSNAKDFAENTDYNDKVITIINEYKSRGYDIILLSASIDPVVEAICNYLSYDDYYASKLNTSNDKYSTGISLDLLDSKAAIVREKNNSLNHLVMISDNVGDAECIPYLDDFIPVILNDKAKVFWGKFNLKFSIDLR